MTTVEWIVIGSALFAVYLFVEVRSRRKCKANRPVAKTPRKTSVPTKPKATHVTSPSPPASEPPRKDFEASSPNPQPPTPLDKPSDPETFDSLPVTQQAEIAGDVSSDGVRQQIEAVWKPKEEPVAQAPVPNRKGHRRPFAKRSRLLSLATPQKKHLRIAMANPHPIFQLQKGKTGLGIPFLNSHAKTEVNSPNES